MSKFNAVLARNIEMVPNGLCGFSHTVAFSHYNHLSAQLPIDPKTNKIVDGDIKDQTLQCFKNIEQVIKGINHVMDDVVRITIFTKSLADANLAKEVYKTFFKTYRPTLTLLPVKNLAHGALVQVEAVITCGEGTIPNAPQAGDLIKVVSNVDLLPKHGCCSHSVAFSHYNNLTSQLPIDPKTGELIKGSIQDQLKQALNNVKAILVGIDVPFDDIVKVNMYVTSIDQIEALKATYKTFFPDSAIARAVGYMPALSIIEAKELPLGAQVMVETIISHGDGTPPQAVEDRHGIVIKFNNTKNAPKCEISSQTVAFSHYNNISSQLPIDAATNEMVEANADKQLSKCLDNLKAVVESVDHKLSDVVKLNIFVKDIKNIENFEKILKSYFTTMPAGRIVEVGNIEKGALVKIDAVVSNAEGTAPIK